jgi:hypothetical protein
MNADDRLTVALLAALTFAPLLLPQPVGLPVGLVGLTLLVAWLLLRRRLRHGYAAALAIGLALVAALAALNYMGTPGPWQAALVVLPLVLALLSGLRFVVTLRR